MAIERSKVRHDFCETYGNNCQNVDRYFSLVYYVCYSLFWSYNGSMVNYLSIVFLHPDIALSQAQVSSGSFCFFSRHKTREIL